jgi:hypothetical protein
MRSTVIADLQETLHYFCIFIVFMINKNQLKGTPQKIFDMTGLENIFFEIIVSFDVGLDQ